MKGPLNPPLLVVYVSTLALLKLGSQQTFQVKENIGLVVLEHLGHELNVHVLDVDFLRRSSVSGQPFPHLKVAKKLSTCRFRFKTMTASLSFSCLSLIRCDRRSELQIECTYNIGDDSREQQALLLLVGALLREAV